MSDRPVIPGRVKMNTIWFPAGDHTGTPTEIAGFRSKVI